MTRMRTLGRTLSTTAFAAMAALASQSCGTSAGSVFGGAPELDASATLLGDEGPSVVLTGDATTRCVPRTCSDQGFTCGVNADGCGSAIDCGTCTVPGEICGGGGPSRCGTTPNGGGDASADAIATSCVPRACADYGYDCGSTGDGCDGALVCGSLACPGTQFCGGGGPNKCGGDSTAQADGGDGGSTTQCVPSKTCATQGYNCGFTDDGCGTLLDCSLGSTPCVSPSFCGGGGANKCGGNDGRMADGGSISTCIPTTCAALGFTCGPAGDGCGGVLDCTAAAGGPCPPPTTCGGGGKPSQCGGGSHLAPDGAPLESCVPATTCPAGTCGQIGDGCGGAIQCPTVCTSPDTCGGGGTPFRCGHPCTGLCQRQVACDGGASTTLTGTVRAGVSAWLQMNGNRTTPDPVPNVLVYVPNGTLNPLGQGYATNACPSCSADVSGDPLVSTYTDFDGTFTLTNVPVGASIPVVVQMGRWRRQFSFPVTACARNAVGDLNLPQNHMQGAIPLTAISTGDADALECVLLKMGIDQSEFTVQGGTGRIHLYAGGAPGVPGGKPGATLANATDETALLASGGSFLNYDQVMLPCWGDPAQKTAAELANLVTYADSGGHFFATHYSYSWLVGNQEFNKVATWNPNADNPKNVNWTLNVSTAVPPSPPAPHVGTFAKWLNLVNGLSGATPNGPVPTPAQVSINSPRYDVSAVTQGSVDWIDGKDQRKNYATTGQSLVEHFTFDTPVGSSAKCGHAIFSDFHVTDASSNNKPFPAECTNTDFTAQEKVLEYMIWDLGSCVTPPPPAVCNPLTCAQQYISCGLAGDGCGHALDCGTCAAPLTCGGGGTAGVCGEPDAGPCIPRDCASQNIQCGPAGNGCGGLIASCGSCPAGQTCGGGGVPGICGAPPEAGVCRPIDCAAQGIACGPAGDGCGNAIASCGTCAPGQTCGGAGVPGQCGAPDGGARCAPLTCSDQHIACGPAGDSCGNLIASCGSCPAGQTCGGGGVPGQCGSAPACTPLTCAELGFNCGPAGDGCGGLLDCGLCTAPSACGGGGTPSVCGGAIPK